VNRPLAPRVAVLIPVYGHPQALRATLDSLLAAELPPRMATLVIDDGSEPPLEIDAVRYAKLGLRLERLPSNRGIVAALNRGLDLAREAGIEFLARLDAGDTAHPQRFARQLACFERDPGLGIVASDVLFVDESGKPLFRFESPRTDADARRRMHINCCLIHPCVMLRMSALEGAYSADYPAAEDYELFLRMLARSRAASLTEALTTSVVSAGGISLARRRVQLRSRLRQQWRYFDARRPESYAGLALTLIFFVLPSRLVARLKAAAGTSRY
jgi:glycosyltransferase involved in cell wall biosynthesis